MASTHKSVFINLPGLFLLRVLLLTTIVLAAIPAQANALKEGTLAPPLTLHTLDGKKIDTRDLKGKVVIVTFWASWCSPCRQELPLLSRYAKAHEKLGLRVLGFSLDDADNLALVKKIAEQLSFPVGLMGSPWAGGYGRIWRLPVSFVINRKGILVDNGWKDASPAWTLSRLDNEITPLLVSP